MLHTRTFSILVALLALLQLGSGAAWLDGPPSPLYPSSGKRHHLPYHPVARFRGADSRPYFPYDVAPYNDYQPLTLNQPSGFVVPNVPEGRLNAGELLALLFSGIREGEPSRMKGTLRFGIARR